MKISENITNENRYKKIRKMGDPAFIEFPTGDKLIVDKENQQLRLINKQEISQLVICIKEEGLVINLNACQININASDQLNLLANKINIEATERIRLKSSGNIVQEIGKDFLTEVGGTNKMIAEVHRITATLGNVEIKANDDVRLDGERIKLNCD